MANARTSIQQKIKGKSGSPLSRLNKILFVAVVMLVIFEVVVSNAKASNGSRMVELQQQYDELQLTVTNLELEVASYSSLTYIEKYATEKLGMEPVEENKLYLELDKDED